MLVGHRITQNTGFDTKMPDSTQNCPFRQQNATHSTHRSPLLSFKGPASFRNYFPPFRSDTKYFEESKILFSLDDLTTVIVLSGGSRRVVGSQILGGSTVKSSIYSSMPAIRSLGSVALYATSQKIYKYIGAKDAWKKIESCPDAKFVVVVCSIAITSGDKVGIITTLGFSGVLPLSDKYIYCPWRRNMCIHF